MRVACLSACSTKALWSGATGTDFNHSVQQCRVMGQYMFGFFAQSLCLYDIKRTQPKSISDAVQKLRTELRDCLLAHMTPTTYGAAVE